MRCIKVNQCCCGCTLRTGTKIIGWLSLVSQYFHVVYLIVLVFWWVIRLSWLKLSLLSIQIKQLWGCIQLVSTWSMLNPARPPDEPAIVATVISAIWIVVSIPLLCAASNNSRPNLLLPWLIFNVLIIFVGICLCIYLFVNLFQQVHHIDIQILCIAFFSFLISLGTCIEKLPNSRRKMWLIYICLKIFIQLLTSILGWWSPATIKNWKQKRSKRTLQMLYRWKSLSKTRK